MSAVLIIVCLIAAVLCFVLAAFLKSDLAKIHNDSFAKSAAEDRRLKRLSYVFWLAGFALGVAAGWLIGGAA